tara:strand:- start:358 stop:726 length:369 start_codon:yes stop_codon:yes gene_type:complete
MKTVIIGLQKDGYQFWIKATAMMRLGRSWMLSFESSEDLLYSKEYIINGYEEILIKITKENTLVYETELTAVDAVMPYTDELWTNILEKDAHIEDKSSWDHFQGKDFEDSLLHDQDERERIQ